MVCKVTMDEQVPYFNAGIYSSTKTKYGQVDEVFGATNDVVSPAFESCEPGFQECGISFA